MFERFRKKNKENQYQKIKESEDDFDPSRRRFLKKSAILAGSMVLSHPLLKLMEKKTQKKSSEEEEDTDSAEDEIREPEEEFSEEATPEQEKIVEEDALSLAEVLSYDKEEAIKLDLKTMEKIKNHWKEKYKDTPELRDSLRDAYSNMGEWYPSLEDEFKNKGVSTDYVYLAIPESHWQMKAVSPAGAVGPYQFMPDTARSYGLQTSYFKDAHSNLEERMDPIKSAGACARLLKDLYNAGGGDWNMALSGYNGGYFWRYLKEARNEKREISYENFLKYLENKINIIKEKVRLNDHYEHQIRKGENIRSISKKFNLGEKEICQTNGINDPNKVYAGQTLKIPISEENKKELFKEKIKGMAENLNYPSKFNAVLELIKEGFVDKQEEPLDFETKTVENRATKHKFKKEDKNIYNISLNYPGVSHRDILDANPELDPTKLNEDDEILIPSKDQANTLLDVAKENGKDIEWLKKTNPAIIDPQAPIPKGYKIRI